MRLGLKLELKLKLKLSPSLAGRVRAKVEGFAAHAIGYMKTIKFEPNQLISEPITHSNSISISIPNSHSYSDSSARLSADST